MVVGRRNGGVAQPGQPLCGGRRAGGGGALGGGVAQEEAEIRLRLATKNKHTTQRRVEENRRALRLLNVSEVTRARHLGWLAYNLMFQKRGGQQRAAADEAAAAAASTGDLEARIMANLTLALLDCGDGYAGRALRQLEELCALARTSDAAAAHELAAMHYPILLAAVGRLDHAAARVADGTGQARREGNAMALAMWTLFDGVVHLAAGRLSAARTATESLPPPEPTGATELDMIRMVILTEVAARTDDRTLLQQMAMTRATPTQPAHLWYVGERRTCSRWRRGSATTSMTRCAGWAATSPCTNHQSGPRS